MRKLFVALFLFLAFISLRAENIDYKGVFEHANQLYINKDYAGAVKEYQKLIDNDVKSAEIYFNLANAYYRLRKTAEAIYYYEKAKRINPNDEDINFNLNVANLRVIDKFKTVPKFFLTEWYEDLINAFSSDNWALWAIVSLWVTMVFMIAFLFVWSPVTKKSLFAMSVLMLIVFVFSLIFTYERTKIENTHNDAIIFSSSVYVKSSPEAKSTDLFILHVGTKVKVKDKIGEWYEIKLPNGSVGWVPINDLKII